jgi:hypothetical protein
MKSEQDLLVGAHIAAKAVLPRLMSAMQNERGVHVESLVTALGALAGRACQVAAITQGKAKDPAYKGLSIMKVDGKNGESYLFGDLINRPLLESPFSVWSLISSKLTALHTPLPPIGELVQHAASTAGSDDYGKPNYAAGTSASDTPVGYLVLWQPTQAIVLESAQDPRQWPMVYSTCMRDVLDQIGETADKTALARVFMESAIATSKLVQSA